MHQSVSLYWYVLKFGLKYRGFGGILVENKGCCSGRLLRATTKFISSSGSILQHHSMSLSCTFSMKTLFHIKYRFVSINRCHIRHQMYQGNCIVDSRFVSGESTQSDRSPRHSIFIYFETHTGKPKTSESERISQDSILHAICMYVSPH